MRLKEDMNICMVILMKSYKNDHCISHTVIIILFLNVLKGPLAYKIKTTTTISNCITPDKPVVHSKICIQSCKTDIYGDLYFTNNRNCQSLERVRRGSETQLQVTENLN